jgi:drug/metabolite transporter (DMT)-like permease
VTVVRTRATRAAMGGAGLALALLAAATFGTSGTFASSLIGAGWSPGAAVLTRLTVAALVLTVPAVIQLRGRWALLRRNGGSAAAYGVLAVAAPQLFYFNAVARIPVGVALLLEYLGIVLVVGWLWLRHGQRPRRLTVTGGAVAIAGLAMVLNLTGPGHIDPIGVMWALLAAVGLAGFFLLSAGGEREPLPPIVMAWAGMCVGAAALAAAGWTGVLPMSASTGSVHVLGHQVSWIVPVLGLSLLAAVISYVAGIGAARRLGAKLVSFVSLSEVLFAILFAWLLLGQLPSAMQFLGGAFILGGVALVRLDELRPPQAPAGPPRSPRNNPSWPPRRRPAAETQASVGGPGKLEQRVQVPGGLQGRRAGERHDQDSAGQQQHP